ncbi:MAG: alpha/beta hydrolase [Bacteroidaceae bacterium]|nr:alpha/beta hydrolase [Bacteroidaceae bacterium]
MNKKIKKGCGCLLGAVLLLAVAGAITLYVLRPKWHDEYGERYKDIAYGTLQHNTYDLYLPHDAAKKDSLALILFIHGGSWIGGDKSLREYDCYPWVQKGYAAATMNYSLLTEEGTSLLTMLDEIEACILHIKSFAEEKGARIRQMAICGISAGGHLAMMFAYARQHPLPIRFEAIKVGPSDFRILFPYDKNAEQKPEDVRDFVFSCTGKHTDITSLTQEEADSIKLIASPITYINDSTALPAIFAYGEKDGIVKTAHYHALQAIYDSLGKPYDLIVFPNSNHFLMGDKDCTERYDSTLADYCNKYFGY